MVDSVFAAMRAGAHGYLLKGADQEETLRAIKAVSRGEAIFSPAIAKRLIRYFSPTRVAATPPQAFPELTEREREILALHLRALTMPRLRSTWYLAPRQCATTSPISLTSFRSLIELKLSSVPEKQAGHNHPD